MAKNDIASVKTPENKNCFHQVVLAKNFSGWQDLLHLVSFSNHKDHFYHLPRIDLEQLAEVASKGNLISFSGHLGSHLANCVLEEPSTAVYEAQRLQNMFGKDNFYIEIQLMDGDNNELARTVAEKLREVASKSNIPVVATPDAHYTAHEEVEDHRVLLCTSLKKTIGQVQRELQNGKSQSMNSFFSSDNFHIPSYEEMKRWHTEKELRNTLKNC